MTSGGTGNGAAWSAQQQREHQRQRSRGRTGRRRPCRRCGTGIGSPSARPRWPDGTVAALPRADPRRRGANSRTARRRWPASTRPARSSNGLELPKARSAAICASWRLPRLRPFRCHRRFCNASASAISEALLHHLRPDLRLGLVPPLAQAAAGRTGTKTVAATVATISRVGHDQLLGCTALREGVERPSSAASSSGASRVCLRSGCAPRRVDARAQSMNSTGAQQPRRGAGRRSRRRSGDAAPVGIVPSGQALVQEGAHESLLLAEVRLNTAICSAGDGRRHCGDHGCARHVSAGAIPAAYCAAQANARRHPQRDEQQHRRSGAGRALSQAAGRPGSLPTRAP